MGRKAKLSDQMLDATEEQGKGIPLNMTPMIDIIFQLLLFFMCGTKMKTVESKIDAYLPTQHGKAVQQEKPPPPQPEINISLRKDRGSDTPLMYVDESKVKDIEQLRSVLTKLAKVSKDIPVVIDPSPEVAFKWVILTLDACAQAGFKDTSFAEPPAKVLEGIK